MAENDERGLGRRSGDRMSRFGVTARRITVKPTLLVSPNFTDEDPDGANLAVAADGVQFSARVTVPETEVEGTWHVGWIQTVYPGSQSVTYQAPSGPGRGNMVATLGRAMADGDASGDGSEADDGDETSGAGHWAWYENPAECNAGKSVTVEMDDQPNVPFHTRYHGSNAPWIKDWHAVATAGQKTFCTWLAAEAPDGEIIYLYHVAWIVDFGATLADGELSGQTTGGARITNEGAGKGNLEPCLESKTIAEQDPPFLPDKELENAKPA